MCMKGMWCRERKGGDGKKIGKGEMVMHVG